MSESNKLTVGKMIELLQQFEPDAQLVRWDSEYYPFGKYVAVTEDEISVNQTLIQSDNGIDLEVGEYYPSIWTTFI